MNPKDAFHHTIHSAPGGCQASAIRMGYSYAILKNKANPNIESNHATLDDVDTAMELFQNYSVLHALAEKHGFVCTRIADGEATDLNVLHSVTEIWTSLGKLIGEVHTAMADGRIDPREKIAVNAAMFEALRPIVGLAASISALAGK